MSLLFVKQIEHHSKIAIWSITESLQELENNPLLADYIEESRGFKSESRRKEWLVVRLILLQSLQVDSVIAYSESGRPYLLDSELSISISHTIGFVAVLISTYRLVSIDIEVPSKRVLALSKRFVRKDEAFSLKKNKLLSNLLIWCSKELLVKLLDRRDVDFKSHLHVLPFRPMEGEAVLYAKQYILQHFTPKYIPIHYKITKEFIFVYSIQQ